MGMAGALSYMHSAAMEKRTLDKLTETAAVCVIGGLVAGLCVGFAALVLDSDGLGVVARILLFPFAALLALQSVGMLALYPIALMVWVARTLRRVALRVG